MTIVLAIALTGASAAAMAQQPAVRADTVPGRADYRDVGELLRNLPRVTPPAIDAARALSLAALPLACLDRLQPRPGGRGRGRGGPPDTSFSRATGAADTSARAVGAPPAGAGANAGGAANNGAGYFWVPTYHLAPDHDRLRAFWGCTDWHSAVASSWATVRLLRTFPHSAITELQREKLNAHLGRSNLDGELSFFRTLAASINPIPSASQQGLYERPYGFAWLLELEGELHTWPDTQAQRWAANAAPLAQWMADSLGAYFSTLVEPVRAGAQNNTAHDMLMALDYADAVGDTRLRRAVVVTARRFFLADTTCATQSEAVIAAGAGRGAGGRSGGARNGSARGDGARGMLPNDLSAAGGRGNAPPAGQVILSPCLSEAALMSRVLEAGPYLPWLDRFLPPLQSGRFAPLTEPIAPPIAAPAVAGRAGAPDSSTAGAAIALATERARVAGLSLSRADDMERIAAALPAADPRATAWHRLAAIQADRGMTLMRDDVAGSHWLPAQALMYHKDAKR